MLILFFVGSSLGSELQARRVAHLLAAEGEEGAGSLALDLRDASFVDGFHAYQNAKSSTPSHAAAPLMNRW